MLVSKATQGLLRNAVLKYENIPSVGIVRYPQNTSQTKQLFTVQKRYKKSSSDEKKRFEEKPKKPRKLLKLATVAVIGTTVAVVAAKYDDDFRGWAKENVPALDDLVKIVFQEEETYLQSLDRIHKKLSAWIKNALYHAFKSRKDGGKGLPSSSNEIVIIRPQVTPYKPPESAFLAYTDGGQKDNTKLSPDVKELKDLEDCYFNAAKEAWKNIVFTTGTLKAHSGVINVLDQIIMTGQNLWPSIAKLHEEALDGLDNVEKSMNNLKDVEEQFLSKLKDNTSVTNDIKEKAQENMDKVKKDIGEESSKLDNEKENTVFAKRSWNKVKKARLFFSEQLETLFPNVWLNDVDLNIPAEDFTPFSENILGEIEFLSQELAKLEENTDVEISSALDKYKKGGNDTTDKVVEAVVPFEENKEKRKQEAEIRKSVLAHKAKCEKSAKIVARQSAEVYADLTAEALKIKEKEVERKMQQRTEEKLAQLKAEHKIEIAKMIGRMQGANSAIASRGDKDKSQQEKQQFWSAAQSLMTAVKPLGGAEGPPKPLKNEIANVSKVKPEGDELVDTVLGTIPQEAVDKGVHSESCLREKFYKVMSSARGWAGVPPGEITLVQLLLARLQAALYLNVAIPQAELDNEPAIDPEQLNNYDILNRAKYFVDKGDFDQAIRYLNLLKGPSSKVTSDWIKEVMTYLETKQAAEVLLAHATAYSMKKGGD